MSVILDIRRMSSSTDIETVIPGAQGRILGALVRLDAPRTISEIARLAGVSRDRATSIVAELERLGLVERRIAGRSHLVSLVDEHPVTQSIRDIDRTRERSIELLREAASELRPAPRYMALYGSWARGEATDESDLDVAVIGGDETDADAFLAALEEWSRLAKRVTGRTPSLVIADGPTKARGPLWRSVRLDAIVLIDQRGANDGA
jgi:predicted nucleotidyltransferase